MNIQFEKWHGCSNDFIIINSTYNESKFLKNCLQEQAKNICSRNGNSIGADGIVVLLNENKSDLIPKEIVIINQDGSLAKNCGNALRCVASFIYKKLGDHPKKIDIPDCLELKIFDRTYLCQKNSKNQIIVTMDTPILNHSNLWHNEYIETLKNLLNNKDYEQIGSCSLGNDHLVVYCQKDPKELFSKISQKWQHSQLKDKVNLHVACCSNPSKSDQEQSQKIIAEQISEIYTTFTWERGCGPTQACGSGACAVATIILENGLNSRSEWLGIKMPGGTLYAKQQEKAGEVKLTGPAQLSFTGSLNL
jgi:diaminopimelate epimerase